MKKLLFTLVSVSLTSVLFAQSPTYCGLTVESHTPTANIPVCGLRVIRLQPFNGYGIPVRFDLLNSNNQEFSFGAVYGSIADNTAGAEKGFLSFCVADGTGSWGNSYQQEKIRVTNERINIKNLLRLEPQNSAPSNPLKGDAYFDNTINKLRVWDGTAWQNCW